MKYLSTLLKYCIPLACLVLVTCSNRGRSDLFCSFYRGGDSFVQTLTNSSQRYQSYRVSKGPAFYVSDVVKADQPQTIDVDFFTDSEIILGVIHTAGFEYIFRREIMIPSMGARWGDPQIETKKGSISLAQMDPSSFCDHTKKIDRWYHEEPQGKPGTVQIGSGEKAKHLYTGIGSNYFWRSSFRYPIHENAKGFSALVAPLEGSAFFSLMNNEMLAFLKLIQLKYPDEYEMWLGAGQADLRNLNWIGKPGIEEKWNNLRMVKEIEWARNWLSAFNGEAFTMAFKDYTLDLQDSLVSSYEAVLEASNHKAEWLSALKMGDSGIINKIQALAAVEQKILLANPLLDFEEILAVQRRKIPGNEVSIGQGPDPFGLPSNFQSLSMLNRAVWDNAIIALPISRGKKRRLIYQPTENRFVGKMDLHFDGDRILVSQPNEEMVFQVYEFDLITQKIRELSPDLGKDVDNYDACYLSSGDIVFASTACYHGVPCVNGSSHVANLCRMDSNGQQMRMLCFDQDDNWHPSLLNNGKVLYTRWEYTDTPHFFTRILMSMNPDGTNQRSYYGSNSYWPNSIFFARAVPEDPGKVVGIVSGHHGTRRAGELHLFDPTLGRHEADGVVQQIPGWGKKVEPIITDRLVDQVWPKFLHPWPLSEKYYLVAGQMNPAENWAIYLVDIYDNITLIRSDPQFHLFEPIPYKARPKPPVIPDRVDLDSHEATVYIQDIYQGPGLEGIPSDAVKSLRLFEWHYAYRGTGGHTHVGIDGPWEPRRLLGTVPVYSDGSAHFKVPANTPIAIQALDESGRAVQIMRSWFTAMPGERLSCIGCHEDASLVPAPKPTLAARKAASDIEPWMGPERAYSFINEVQPVLDQYCVGCHSGQETDRPDFSKGKSVKPLRGPSYEFTASYVALHPYVRRPGPENDYHLPHPMEYHANQTELVQLLRKGHHGVSLSEEAWERLYTWIDLNVPDHGTWQDHTESIEPFIARRMELRSAYAGLSHNPEIASNVPSDGVEYTHPVGEKRPEKDDIALPGWPFNSGQAKKMQAEGDQQAKLQIDLGQGLTMEFVRIPAGRFVMGSNKGPFDEYPVHQVTIDQGFYMASFETSLEQFRLFKADHEQGVINWTNKDQGARGYPLENPNFPAVRVSLFEARAFCDWLSERTAFHVDLPTETEWEWACRAGTDTDLFYGGLDHNFADWANLADAQLARWARRESPQWQPRMDQVDDGYMIICERGQYQPNAWGLYDMHGNVAEWTASKFTAYPGNEGLMKTADAEMWVVRGGSWYDRPYRARSGYRLDYAPYQKPYNVGFRVVIRN